MIGDLDFNPNDIEKTIKDANEKLKITEMQRDEMEKKAKQLEERVSDLTRDVKSLQSEVRDAEKAFQGSERAKDRVEMQFERTKETMLLQVKFFMIFPRTYNYLHLQEVFSVILRVGTYCADCFGFGPRSYSFF